MINGKQLKIKDLVAELLKYDQELLVISGHVLPTHDGVIYGDSSAISVNIGKFKSKNEEHGEFKYKTVTYKNSIPRLIREGKINAICIRGGYLMKVLPLKVK